VANIALQTYYSLSHRLSAQGDVSLSKAALQQQVLILVSRHSSTLLTVAASVLAPQPKQGHRVRGVLHQIVRGTHCTLDCLTQTAFMQAIAWRHIFQSESH